jgi:hypothetical protein
VCPPQGLTPCLETAARRLGHCLRVVGRPGRARKQASPEQSADHDQTLVRRIVVSCYAVSPYHCSLLRDNAGCDGASGREISSWRVLVDLSHAATCVWLASLAQSPGGGDGAGGDAPEPMQVIRWTRPEGSLCLCLCLCSACVEASEHSLFAGGGAWRRQINH